MLRKRLAQILISGIAAACAAVILALADRVAQQEAATRTQEHSAQPG